MEVQLDGFLDSQTGAKVRRERLLNCTDVSQFVSPIHKDLFVTAEISDMVWSMSEAQFHLLRGLVEVRIALTFPLFSRRLVFRLAVFWNVRSLYIPTVFCEP
jgi:hypothetical protein